MQHPRQLATAFRNWRQKHNIPLKQVAADLGLSVATVNKWELGQRFPTGRHLEMLAEYTRQPPMQAFLPDGRQVRAHRVSACLAPAAMSPLPAAGYRPSGSACV